MMKRFLLLATLLLSINAGAQSPSTITGYNPCADTTGTGTAGICNTPVPFAVITGSCIVYTTTTANTGTGLTWNVNGQGAKSVSYAGSTTLAANYVKANQQVHACYDGTNWEISKVDVSTAGSGTVTVVGAGSLTSTALVTGGGTTQVQTPSATSTLSAAGNMSLPGTLAVTGHVTLEGVTSTGAQGTGSLVFSASPTFTGTIGGAAETLTGIFTDSTAGASSASPFQLTGAPFVGTGTTSTPLAYLNQGTAPTTWNSTASGGTEFGINTAGGFVGNLFDAHVNGGTSVASINYQGNGLFAGTLGVTGHVTLEGVTSAGATGTNNLVFSTSPTLVTPTLGAAAATTPAACDNSTNVATTAFTNSACNNIKASGSPFTMLGVSGYYWNNTAAGYTFQLDAPTAGKQYCFGNYQARAQIITVKSTTSVTIYYKGVAGTVTTGTLVSGGAAGDFVCMEGTDTTTYMVTGAGFGTWTNN